MKRNGQHPINRRVDEILRSLYGVAREDGAVLDGKIPHVLVNRRGWAKQQTEHVRHFATRIVADVIAPAVRPYEKALLKYSYHLPDCDTWQDETKDCSCGLDDIRRILKNHFSLEVEQVEKGTK